MKKTFVGILICFAIISSTISTAMPHHTTQPETTTLDDDVPTWKVGNSWTYAVNEFIVHYNYEGQSIYITGDIQDFIWKVTDTSDANYYTVSVSGKITATYDISMSSMSANLQVKGSWKPLLTRLTGTIQFTKSNLQIHHATIELRGLTAATISPLKIPLPLPFRLTGDGQLSTDFPLFNFPLSSNKFWSMPSLDITMNLNVGGLFGIVQIPITLGVHYSWTPFAFHCQSKQDITVPAGTFSAYKIASIFGEYFEYYYAPTAGNLIKMEAKLQNGEGKIELKSMNYP